MCANQATASFEFETGLRYVAVEHVGHRASSPEEAERIAAEIERTRRRHGWTDCNGVARPIRHGDILVVAPYNAQVRCLRAKLPAAVAVGTVDKFQGQEAPIVFFSMATSSGGGHAAERRVPVLAQPAERGGVAREVPRVPGREPRLLEIRCRTIEQMKMVNALCRLVEVAACNTL